MRRTSRYICIYKKIILLNRMIKYLCNLICLIGFLFPPIPHQKFTFNRSSVRISINLSITSSISRHKIEPGMGIVLGTRSLTNFDGPRSSPSPFCGPGEGDPLTLSRRRCNFWATPPKRVSGSPTLPTSSTLVFQYRLGFLFGCVAFFGFLILRFEIL